MACASQVTQRDGSFSFFGGLFLACAQSSSPTRLKFFIFRGAVWSLCQARGPHEAADFSFSGGGAFTCSGQAAPRVGKFFLFGGPFVLTLAFSAPRFFKNFLFGGLHDSPFALVSVQKTELRFLHCPLSPKSQCICPKMGFCTDFTKQAVSTLTPKWDFALSTIASATVQNQETRLLHCRCHPDSPHLRNFFKSVRCEIQVPAKQTPKQKFL